MKSDVLQGCEPFGAVEKVTIFENNPRGIVVVKFKHANAADNVCIVYFREYLSIVREEDGWSFFCRKAVKIIVVIFLENGNTLISSFWDGHTDYRVKMSEDEENAKLESFANWIEGDDSED